jgi:hypothetical protein
MIGRPPELGPSLRSACSLEHESRSSLFMTLCRAELHRLVQQCFSLCSPRLRPPASRNARNAPRPAGSAWKAGPSGRQDGQQVHSRYKPRGNLDGGIRVLDLTENEFRHRQV